MNPFSGEIKTAIQCLKETKSELYIPWKSLLQGHIFFWQNVLKLVKFNYNPRTMICSDKKGEKNFIFAEELQRVEVIFFLFLL